MQMKMKAEINSHDLTIRNLKLVWREGGGGVGGGRGRGVKGCGSDGRKVLCVIL